MRQSFLLLVFCFLYACSPSNISEESSDPKIPEEVLLYISSRAEGFDIYKSNISGTEEVKMTTNPGFDWLPQILNKGETVIYNSQDTSGIFEMKAMDLSGQPIPFSTSGLPELTVSPDAQQAAFTRKYGDSTQIVLLPFKSIKDSLIIEAGASYNGRMKWSPDSKKIAFISDRTGSNELFLFDLPSKTTTQLTQNEKREKYITWAPDNEQLAVTMSDDNTENDIYLINMTSKTVNQLTDTPINESEIAWSISGKYIAYHAKVKGQDDIFLLEIGNGNIIQVTNGEGYHGEPAWALKQ